ncbi:response regulator transcription factor [Micromonospora sp. KC606]|uniref:response regulator n=1 Tax=Micromonospora sp. KC606 TaxID=2530379 RepID=UPI00104D1FD1|nr:response regulator transcription factor [Micromonospora sp. KC606]TDC85777.1 response regulator transcription factor [Micromonospora sp. KC606]
MPRERRVIVAEDDVLTREGIMSLIARFGHRVAAAVGDADALVAAVREQRPDVVVTDVRMPPTFTDEGLQAALRLRQDDPALPILVVSQYVEQTYAAELLESARPGTAGIGYLLKDRIGEAVEFIEALDRVAEGHTVVDTEVVRQMLSRRRDPLTRLTPREREVLSLVAEGRSNAAIARALFITETAVAKHIGSVLIKLDLHPDEDDHRRVRAVLAYLRG